MTTANVKITAALAIALLFLSVGGGVVAWKTITAVSTDLTSPNSPIVSQPTSRPQTFETLYAVDPNDPVRQIKPPFSKLRDDFYRKTNPAQAAMMPNGPDGMIITSKKGQMRSWGMSFTGGRGHAYEIQSLCNMILGYSPQEIEGDPQLLSTFFDGDFVVDMDATPDQLRQSLTRILARTAGVPVTMTLRNVDRPVIVFQGRWPQKPATAPSSGSSRSSKTIELYGSVVEDPSMGGGGGTGHTQQFADNLGEWIHQQVLIEATGLPRTINWHYNEVFNQFPNMSHNLKMVCDHISEQTGLTWSEQTRNVKRLFIERGQ